VIRVVGVLLVAGLLLGACGTISATKAMTSWSAHSDYVANAKTLVEDAGRSAKVLRNPSTSNAGLHTVCAVMDFDALSMNSSLPTPDHQATNLLSKAVNQLGAAANECYDANSSASARARALRTLVRAGGDLAEASARIASASAS
jgi:hypothetical protein